MTIKEIIALIIAIGVPIKLIILLIKPSLINASVIIFKHINVIKLIYVSLIILLLFLGYTTMNKIDFLLAMLCGYILMGLFALQVWKNMIVDIEEIISGNRLKMIQKTWAIWLVWLCLSGVIINEILI